MQLGREIQIFTDGDLIWWGVIVRPQAGLDETTWQCVELLWYFAHRFMGRADRTNLLTNGQFESGESDWSFSGVTHSIDTGTVNEGTNSLKLTAGQPTTTPTPIRCGPTRLAVSRSSATG